MWFEFFEAQKLWGNELQVPVLPIRSWAGGFITRLDGVALLIGLISAVVAVSWLIQKFYRKKPVVTDQAIIFSVFYLAGISLMVLLFRGGSLFSLNRFVFATPFFILFIKYLGNEFMINKKYLFFIGSFVALTAYWLLFFSFVHVQAFLKYELVSIFFLFIIYFINKNRFEPRIYQLLGVLILVELQIYLMLRFLSGEWVA
ncbi:MAG: hypothetical protein JNJ99_15865 [Crocinitomicaceae bacterium]|nr:hypothetical protein [Crocinitomicaceae bacterium]